MVKSLFVALIFFTISCQHREADDRQATPISYQTTSLTAGEVIHRIKQQITCPWEEETVDTYKSGGDESLVTGIATTFLATYDVLKRAQAEGCNMIITHEPTFYNHRDDKEFFRGDPVFQVKQAFISEYQMVIFRFHDHWHRTRPDGIYEGVLADLQWKGWQNARDTMVFTLPEQTVGTLAKTLKDHFRTPAVRVVGNPDQKIKKVGLALGAPGARAQIQMLRRSDVQVLITGETQEWETVEWVRDAVSQGNEKVLILIGHANSEEAGMKYCAEWLQGFISEVPIKFIPAGDPFWGPE